jgi:rubrerythrin
MVPFIVVGDVDDVFLQALKLEEYEKSFFKVMAWTTTNGELEKVFQQLAIEEEAFTDVIRQNLIGACSQHQFDQSFEQQKLFHLCLDIVITKSEYEIFEHAIKLETHIISIYRKGLAIAREENDRETFANLIGSKSKQKDKLLDEAIDILYTGKTIAPIEMAHISRDVSAA